MLIPNKNYKDLKDSYLFYKIAQKTRAYVECHEGAYLYRLGIGDVSLPLCDAVIKALHEAVDDQAKKETFHGYMPECGAHFFKTAVAGYYEKRGVRLDVDEVFVSSGASDELGDILDLFDKSDDALITEPAYPAYVDSNVMAGRKIVHLASGEENGFLPLPDKNIKASLLYICSPNNPTGAAYSREQLAAWVEYARKNGAVILYDAAYECFVGEEGLARSIYEVEGAKECAVEFCSFSKIAGFTGTRCGYTVVPHALAGGALNKMWLRRQTTKFNGVPYIVQRGAAAVFTPEGEKQIAENLAVYRRNAKRLSDCLDGLGIRYTGGKNSPYVWLRCPGFDDSWKFFDYLLEEANVVGTPGCGFGKNGQGYFRLTAFGGEDTTAEAVERLKKLLKK